MISWKYFGKLNKYRITKSSLLPFILSLQLGEDAHGEKSFPSERKGLWPRKHPDVEAALIMWMKEMRSRDIPPRGPIFMSKEADLALQ